MSRTDNISLESSRHLPQHLPQQPTGEGLALTHGAGGDCNSALLIAIADAFCQAGVTVLRFNLAYRKLRPKGPPSPATGARDRDSIRRALETMRGLVAGPIYMGGQSYGGRQASMVAAEDGRCADALALFSYPLHPPGKPAQLRTEHFPAIAIPALFTHGPRDPFASGEELEVARVLIPARTSVYEVPKAGHELLGGKFDLRPVIAALRDLAR